MNRHDRRRAKALKGAALIFVSFGRAERLVRNKATCTCITCGGEANDWPVGDDPALLACGLAEVRRGKETAEFCHEREMLTSLPLCEACYGSRRAETGDNLIREVFGDDVEFGEPFEVSEEVAEAMMDKPSA
jgi:hypothetical protein